MKGSCWKYFSPRTFSCSRGSERWAGQGTPAPVMSVRSARCEGWDIVVSKYSAGGAPVWSKRYGNTGIDSGNAIAADGAGMRSSPAPSRARWTSAVER